MQIFPVESAGNKKCWLQEKKSSHNFLHNRIVTFSHCVPSDGRKSFLLVRSHCHLLVSSGALFLSVVCFLPLMSHQIHFLLPQSQQCSSSSFFMRESVFFGCFYKFYRHHHENCRRVLTWNFNLIHIIAESRLTPFSSFCHHFQANSSIFVQSHTADFINCTTSASVTTSAPTQHKKLEASYGKWEPGSLIEPLQIHLPASNYTTTHAIKTEKNHSGSSNSSTSSASSKPHSASKRGPKVAKGNKNINECILSLHQQHQSKTTDTKVENNGGTGCSRTLPLTWNQALQQLQNNVNTSIASSYGNCPSADTTTHTTATLLQIKREPCQVSEVTTSNLIATNSYPGTPAIIKIEQKSPTTTSSSTLASISSSMDSNNTNGGQQNNGEFKKPFFFYCQLKVANCNPFPLVSLGNSLTQQVLRSQLALPSVDNVYKKQQQTFRNYIRRI